MGKKLYVGNLSFTIDANQLSDTFAHCGMVESVNLITDRETGRSKGFAFIEMSSENDAQNAIEKYNGFEMGGRAMNVSEAKPQENRASDGRSPRRGRFSARTGY